MRIRDAGWEKFESGIRDKHPESGIRDKHPGSATLVAKLKLWIILCSSVHVVFIPIPLPGL